MYSYIKGTLEEIGEDKIVVENQGIGYNIYVSKSVLDNLASVGETVKIYTYLNVKEDALTLFGFFTKDEIKIFRLLLGVNGIGPKGALAVLSALGTDNLRFAILAGDSKAIAKAPGIGAKTAQRIILELKDKLDLAESFKEDGISDLPKGGDSYGNTVKNEAVEALVALGYSSTEAFSVVSKIEITQMSSVEDVLKAALKEMAFL